MEVESECVALDASELGSLSLQRLVCVEGGNSQHFFFFYKPGAAS